MPGHPPLNRSPGLRLKCESCNQTAQKRFSANRFPLSRPVRNLKPQSIFVAKATLVVCKLDRLARSVRDLVRIIDTPKAKDVGLRILNMNFDTASPTGKMMLTILGSIAEFEREIMLERQKEGIARAHSEGKYRGRAPTARAKSDQVFALDRAGKTRESIAKEVGISLISVYRILRTHKGAEKAPVVPPVKRIRTRSQVSA
jgi:DNA invertase Pin-like site-specific DNA recombinase